LGGQKTAAIRKKKASLRRNRQAERRARRLKRKTESRLSKKKTFPAPGGESIGRRDNKELRGSILTTCLT